MSRNSHKRGTAHRPMPQPWFWLLIGLLLGVVGVLLLPSQRWLPWTTEGLAQDKTATLQDTEEIKKTGTAPIAPPDFEFYTLLPKMEVAVPKFQPEQPSPQPQPPSQPESDSSSATRPTSQPQSPPQSKREAAPSSKPEVIPLPNAKSATYVLQAGSFRSYAQANKREAYLALMGVEAAIHTVTIDNDETWHRVRVGPSTNLSKLRRIRRKLRNNQIRSLLYKINS